MLGGFAKEGGMDARRARKARRRSVRKAKAQATWRRRSRTRVAPVPAVPPGFGRRQFGAAALGDRRRTERLVKTADRIMAHPAGTLPQKLKAPADLEGLYRLANDPAVTHAAVIGPHCAATRAAVAAHGGVVLLVHDTTELDYSGLRATEGLGPIGNGGCRGYLCHNSLAVDAATGAVLGLASQILHTRRRVPKGETPAQRRDHPGRESRLWKAGCQACAARGPGAGAGANAGADANADAGADANADADANAGADANTGAAAAAGTTIVVDLCDAGGDAFEVFDYECAAARRFVIRAGKDRLLGGESAARAERVKRKLYAYTRGLPDLGGRYVWVAANTNKRNGKHRKQRQTARLARCRIAAGPVTLPVPAKPRGEHGDRPLVLWVVHVREVDPPPPDGERPLEWVLLTNVPADTLAQAAERIDWYARRPVVEEYHKAQKTGAGVELLQFGTKAALEPVIALLSVVAVALLQLREAARRPDARDTPAATWVPPAYVRVLSGWRLGRPDPAMSVYDFALALARLGGHQNRARDGPPGWLTLWRGWNDLHMLVLGARAAGLRCDER
jgi:hypothetical protein